MHYWQSNYRLFFYLVVVTLFLTGCAEQIKQPTRICPGKETAIEALTALELHSQKVAPLKANGQCRLEYYTDGKLKKENFPVRLWLNPPAEIYMQGDVAFDPRGIVLGSNENEFWLAIRLKEISSYWWGRWAETGSADGLLIDPRIVLEALGIVVVDTDEIGPENWSLSKEGAFDVLTTRNDQAGIIKKIFIYNCDYSIRKIQYFDIDGTSELTVELYKYKQVVENFFAPRIIKIIKSGESIEDLTSVTVRLTSVKSISFSETQRKRLFSPPRQQGFKHIYINVDGKWIERLQD